SITIFINQSFLTPFNIKVGDSSYNLQLNVTHNNLPAANASIQVQEKFGLKEIYSNYTNEEGLININNVPENFYIILVNFNKLERNMTVRLNRTLSLEIELISSLTLNIIDIASGTEVNGGRLEIENISYSVSSFQSGTPIFLDDGEYKIEYEINDIIRHYLILIKGQTNHTIFVGTSTLYIHARGEEMIGLDSTNVTIKKDGQIITRFLTNSSGFFETQLEIGFLYNIIAFPENNMSRIQNRSINFKNTTYVPIDFINNFQLNLLILNGSLGRDSGVGVVDCNVTIFKNDTFRKSYYTNGSGSVSFNFTEPGVYFILANKSNFDWEGNIQLYHEKTKFNISLGKVNLTLSAQSITGNPIEGASISIIDNGTVINSGITNETGFVSFLFPVGEYNILIAYEDFIYQKSISYFESDQYLLNMTIEFSGDLDISLTNQYVQNVKKAYIILKNNYYNLKLTGFTDIQGKISFYNIPWGNYSIEAVFDEEDYFVDIIEMSALYSSFSLIIETPNPILEIDNFNWQDTGTFSVILSSEYVTGFLETTLVIIITTFTSLIVIISVLSLLSIASVISNPIVSNEKTISTFKLLGASKNQVTLGVLVHLSILGVIASIIGAFFGMLLMINIPTLKNINVGGIIIKPKIDTVLLILISSSNLGVIMTKTVQKARDVYMLC
ncbi:MAG: FtsX-like permease family protein, partial [Candidatus Hodarchaeales archaeon]